MTDTSWLRWAAGTIGELNGSGLLRAAPSLLRDYLPNLVRRPAAMALSARVALTASLSREVEALVASGTPVLFIWADSDRIVAPGALADIVTSLPAEIIEGRHGWLLTEPEEFATLLRNALVVHTMLERKRRGQAVVLPRGASLADLIPPERRSAARRGDEPGAAPGRMRR
jgi:pimeloyl-ACP methyl ester carboxylesterase